MPMIQLTYASRPFGFDTAMLAGILLDARRCNTRDGITGLLICRADLYLQLLEGPEAAVDAAYRRIAADDRHMDLSLLTRRSVTHRLFPRWAMRDDPARSWLWTKAEVDDGALTRASEDDVLAVFERIAGEE
ncbi:MAG: BLUF domain-containing protein [Tabrizicola sp.]|nr:BLUF domain-containing protein [Tabrizicola sp.]MDP3263086.1 BLUF domain-containing protein [Tabrizicola sp.]MDP3649793.1 BLUF domain-containing protein [Paracoccaceae bacterium]